MISFRPWNPTHFVPLLENVSMPWRHHRWNRSQCVSHSADEAHRSLAKNIGFEHNGHQFSDDFLKWNVLIFYILIKISQLLWPGDCLVLVMMTSSNGNIFRVTGPLCREFTGPGEFPTQRPVTRSFDVFFFICVWINGWVNNREAGDLRRYQAHYDVIVMDTMMYQGANKFVHQPSSLS